MDLKKTELNFNEEILFEINSVKSLLVSNKGKLHPSMCLGAGGISLAFYYHSRWYGDQSSEDFAEMLLKNIVSQEKYKVGNTYSSGYGGLAWLLTHLESNNFINISSNFLDDIDNQLDQQLEGYLRNQNFDFLHGAIGILNYFLEREERENSVIKGVKALYKCADWSVQGQVKWLFFNPVQKISSYNLSVSHGVSSLIIFLCKCHDKGLEKELCAELISKAINFLLNQKFKKGSQISLYPNAVFPFNGKEVENVGSRLAWCYGDLGIGFALLKASKTIDRLDLYKEAQHIFLHACERRSYKNSLVKDFAFCHGSIGVAHIFYRAYLEFKLPIFKETYNFWIQKTLKMKVFPDVKGGYKTYYGSMGWKFQQGLLEGVAGTFIVLSGIESKNEPSWDEYFLLS